MAIKSDKYTVKKFNKISIGLASPEVILEKSNGEVLKPETINYRTHKPERDGLFCERIFGPIKDYECACGKYKRIRYKGIVCDRCGVEVTEKKVRRDRVGHINLVVPVAHIWYFKSLPNKMGYLLGLPSKKLDMIIYYERYVVIQPAGAKNAAGEPLQKMDFLTEEEYLNIIKDLDFVYEYFLPGNNLLMCVIIGWVISGIDTISCVGCIGGKSAIIYLMYIKTKLVFGIIWSVFRIYTDLKLFIMFLCFSPLYSSCISSSGWMFLHSLYFGFSGSLF